MTTNEIPQVITRLIEDIEAAGGTATRDGDRNRWEFTLPRTFANSEGTRRVCQQIAGSAGYFVRDNQVHYRGVRQTREQARTWGIKLNRPA